MNYCNLNSGILLWLSTHVSNLAPAPSTDTFRCPKIMCIHGLIYFINCIYVSPNVYTFMWLNKCSRDDYVFTLFQSHFLSKAIIYEGQDKNPEMCRVLLTHEIMCR